MTQKLVDLRFQLVSHPPCSPDLATSDFHLFPKLKVFLAGQKFANDNEVKARVDTYFEELPETHFRTETNALETRWMKCVELRGDYVEK